jgi:hypothetical protein
VLKADDRDSVRAAVSQWKAADLEAAVVAAGGCAAAMHDRDDWLSCAPGAASAAAPALAVTDRPLPAASGIGAGAARAERPYAGVRVLDLTRVIAGPVATKFLAAYGADVLRLDPPGFAEVPALLPETTAGKRTAAVDLATPAGRGRLRATGRRRRRPGNRAARGRSRPARLRRRDADRAEPRADHRVAQRLRLERAVAGPARVRQPGADELRHRGRGRRGRACPAARAGA